MVQQSIVPDITFPKRLRRSQFVQIKKGTSPQYNYELDEYVASPEGRIELNDVCTFRQIVMNTLLTPRGVYPIYDFSYGTDILQLIGQHPDYVTARLPHMVEDALKANRRVSSVTTQDITIEGDKIFYTVLVVDALTGVRVRLDLDVSV